MKERIGLEELGEALHGRTSALSGPSGVGKSSLLNAIYPGLDFRVGEISESVNKGRHTTVGAAMHPLPDGSFVVDTPGLREIGVWNLRASDLDDCFLEFRPFLGHCKFGDCTHVREPGCAVREAAGGESRSARRATTAISSCSPSSRRRRRIRIEPEHFTRGRCAFRRDREQTGHAVDQGRRVARAA